MTVTPPEAEDRKIIDHALTALGVHIGKDQEWDELNRLSKAALDAASKISANVSGRTHA